jgi:putative addiction module component (TIGR02574 family)
LPGNCFLTGVVRPVEQGYNRGERRVSMDPQNQALFDAALSLPEAERILLVQDLLETLSPDAKEEELAEELDRRLEEARQGKAEVVSWTELKQQS